jgi:gamma-glutamylcyclotransferase (GGCT)/AIG2-like uncharacterized protein YtfP
MTVPEQATILVAAYGTARPGHELYDQIKGSVLSYKLSRIMGILYWHKSKFYPVADLSSQRSTIVTTTLEMILDTTAVSFIKTELLCGYTPVYVDELNRDTEQPTGRKVLAFDFDSSGDYGNRIHSGDWNTASVNSRELAPF